MKDEFLVINHNIMLRKLYLKCNTLFFILENYEQNNKKKILNNILQENTTLNKYLDNKTNIIESNNIEINQQTNSKADNNKEINKNIDTKNIDTKNIDKKNEIIFSPRNDIIVEIETVEDMDETANKKCKEGCNLCYNGCDLFFTGIHFVCSFINHYMNRLATKLKKCFDN